MASRQNRSISLFRQAEAILRDQISEGTFPAGSKLPPEDELSQQFGMSRGTLRQALAALERDQLIERLPGRGTFVRAIPRTRRVSSRIDVEEAIAEAAMASRLIRFGNAVPPEQVVQALQLEKPEATPFSIRVSAPDARTRLAVKRYWHPQMAARIDPQTGDPFDDESGFQRHSLAISDVWIDAILAEPRFAMMLKVAPGSPLLSVWWVETVDGHPFCCTQMLRSGTDLSLSIPMRRGQK